MSPQEQMMATPQELEAKFWKALKSDMTVSKMAMHGQ
jgi:hypothetical protein